MLDYKMIFYTQTAARHKWKWKWWTVVQENLPMVEKVIFDESGTKKITNWLKYHLYGGQTFRSIRGELFYEWIDLDEKEVLIKTINILRKMILNKFSECGREFADEQLTDQKWEMRNEKERDKSIKWRK
jgi:hypothetical protein